MKRLIYAALLAAATASCGGGHSSQPTTVVDSTIYEMGRSRGADMFSACNDSTEMRIYLLDTQAEIYDIEQKKGRQSAFDYRRGFEDFVKFYDPALAAELF